MSCAIFYANLVIFVALCVMALLGHMDRYSSDKSSKIVYLYMSGCPHCVRFMPEWDNFAKSSKISTLKLEMSDPKAPQYTDIARKAGIFHGYPCVFYMNGSNIVEYGGARTASALAQWSAKLV